MSQKGVLFELNIFIMLFMYQQYMLNKVNIIFILKIKRVSDFLIFLQIILLDFCRWSTHWFKLDIDLSSNKNWTNKEVRLRWNSNSEAMVIFFFISPQIRILCFHWLKQITCWLHTCQAFLYSKVQFMHPTNFRF